MNIWMIGENLIKLHYLKNNILIDGDYVHAKTVCKNFEIKNLAKYNDLYVQRDTLQVTDVFEIWNMKY